MEYRKFGNQYVVQIPRGEELIEKLTELVEKENIKLASVSGIGAVDEVKIGIYDTVNKKYDSITYRGDFEISALVGNISTMKEKPYLHLHITIGNVMENKFYCGHLNYGVISATSEIFITAIDGEVDREFSEDIGLNLMKFDK
ncbi:PPC domain-containing DNA-binding protein [Clostridium culturomicium]|uniref:PPC domain-containing DNA-binding protein n=1 Tax=Clostridium culturomicium TaxID=1499683 RepID=UPI00058CA0F7|nr:PPC domain-containing DNA-binding protein [Clostridium culturomicium]